MSFSFAVDLTTPVARVRQLIGDTAEAGHRVEDETITAYLETRTELTTAAQLARDIAAKVAGEIDVDVDGQSHRRSQRYEHYKSLAERLERQAAAESAATTSSGGTEYPGVAVFGSTAQEVIDARDDCDAATNAPLRWG